MAAKFGKEEWVGLFRQIGLSDEQMDQWHRLFEADFPTAHQSFLEWLQISEGEINEIRRHYSQQG